MKKSRINGNTDIEAFMLIVERTPFEKGASLKLSPENFWFYFFPYRARPVYYRSFLLTIRAL